MSGISTWTSRMCFVAIVVALSVTGTLYFLNFRYADAIRNHRATVRGLMRDVDEMKQKVQELTNSRVHTVRDDDKGGCSKDEEEEEEEDEDAEKIRRMFLEMQRYGGEDDDEGEEEEEGGETVHDGSSPSGCCVISEIEEEEEATTCRPPPKEEGEGEGDKGPEVEQQEQQQEQKSGDVDRESLRALKVAELRTKASEMGVSTRGGKDELVERIVLSSSKNV